jgi:OOP family OmpA-OmpF porin
MKKATLILALAIISVSMHAQKVYTKAHPKNYRSWGLGLNVNNTIFLGDLSSFERVIDDLPAGLDDYGGMEIGAGLHLTKWVAPSVGLRLSASYYSFSGTNSTIGFEGNGINGGFDVLFNLSNVFLQGLTQDRRSALILGVGVNWLNSKSRLFDQNGNEIGETGTADIAGDPVNPPRRSNMPYLSGLAEYKYRMTNALDLDAGVRVNYFGQDWLDVVSTEGSYQDVFSQLYVGVTYNFKGGEDDRDFSAVYANPLDEIYASVEEVQNNFDKLTSDDDKDGVNNYFDKEDNTPEGSVVDGSGKALDVDADGIPDYMDEDPYTAKGAQVDSKGRAVDSDNDGVADYMDEEPNTPEGTMVNFKGKTIKVSSGGAANAYIPSVFFAFNSATVTAANYERLAVIAKVMKSNPDMKVKVVGYTDKIGSEEYNKNLSMRRAQAVVKALNQTFGIAEGRFSTEAEGESNPLAENRNDVNRRADLMPQ